MSGQRSRVPRAEPRSAGIATARRVPVDWPADRDFRILAIDGGGIRGIFPAAVLAALEQRFLAGSSVAEYFDLIVGTSTGGIIALGLAAGLPASGLRDLYVERGNEIFPPSGVGFIGAVRRWLKDRSRLFRYSYDSAALEGVLQEVLGDRKLGHARTRLCIPSFEGRYGEVFVFKTPHHPDFRKDLHEQMVTVALATAAAPTYFRPHRAGGYTFVDGGIWANNPVMIGLTEALSSFNVSRERVRILSLGCGSDPYTVDNAKILMGGMLHWRDIIVAAMRLQSQNALGQTGLLIGPENQLRLDIPDEVPAMPLDDWRAAIATLPAAALASVDRIGERVSEVFLSAKVLPYKPTYLLDETTRQ